MSASFWDQLRIALGLDEPGAVQTAARFIQVLLVVLIAAVAARWTRRRIERVARANPNHADAGVLASRGAALLVYLLGLTIALALLGANWTVLATVLGAATFGLSLAFQDVAKNLIDGTYLLIERPFRLGDRVKIGDVEGRVEKFGVRLTTLRTDSGGRIALPNSLVFTSAVENATIGVRDHQRFVITGIPLPADQVAAAISEALAAGPGSPPRQATIDLTSIGPEGVDVAVSVDTALGGREINDMMRRLHQRFPEAVISAKPADDA